MQNLKFIVLVFEENRVTGAGVNLPPPSGRLTPPPPLERQAEWSELSGVNLTQLADVTFKMNLNVFTLCFPLVNLS